MEKFKTGSLTIPGIRRLINDGRQLIIYAWIDSRDGLQVVLCGRSAREIEDRQSRLQEPYGLFATTLLQAVRISGARRNKPAIYLFGLNHELYL
jgi:hypothetical protein